VFYIKSSRIYLLLITKSNLFEMNNTNKNIHSTDEIRTKMTEENKASSFNVMCDDSLTRQWRCEVRHTQFQ
jgi:hypothetical protein